ncbi:carboxypeptidase-like regulatory domain-containing protein [bacterium]|nr:carboxypeptidase-like regulatory domain-containing protein [bacterium]
MRIWMALAGAALLLCSPWRTIAEVKKPPDTYIRLDRDYLTDFAPPWRVERHGDQLWTLPRLPYPEIRVTWPIEAKADGDKLIFELKREMIRRKDGNETFHSYESLEFIGKRAGNSGHRYEGEVLWHSRQEGPGSILLTPFEGTWGADEIEGILVGTFYLPDYGGESGVSGDFRIPMGGAVIDDAVDQVTIVARHPNYEVYEDTYRTKSIPESIWVTGRVMTDEGEPIPGTEIEIVEYSETGITDSEGEFSIRINLENGFGEWHIHDWFEMTPNMTGMKVQQVSKEELFANGKSQLIEVELTADGRPLENRKLSVGLNWDSLVDCKGKNTELLTTPMMQTSADSNYYTDGNGRVKLYLQMPVWKNRRMAIMEDADRLVFPVSVELTVMDVETQKSCRTTIAIESPFPHIKRLSIPPTHAGDFQSRPGSHLIVTDPDSRAFEVAIQFAGDIKLETETGLYEGWVVTRCYDGDLKFLYRPPAELSDNIKKTPSLFKECAKANLKYVAEKSTETAAGKTFDQISVVSKARNSESKSRLFTQIGKGDPSEIMGMGVNGVKMVKTTGDVAALIQDESRKPKDSPTHTGDQIVNCVDSVFGVVDGVLGTFGVESTPTAEVGKVIYANMKAVYKVHRENEKIAHSYSESFRATFRFVISDDDGNKVLAVRRAPMWAYRKGD